MKKLVTLTLLVSLMLTACSGPEGQTTTSLVEETTLATESEEEKALRLAKEEEDRLAAEAEAKRLEEEAAAKLREEEEKRLAEIKAKTYYAKDQTLVYSDEALTSKTEVVLGHQTPVWVKDQVTNEAGEVTAYLLEAIDETPAQGYVSVDRLKQEKYDWISIPYEGVDYSAFERTEKVNNPPVEVKAVYVTQATARNDNGRLDNLIRLTKETEINAFVIDVKNDDGHLLFYSETAEAYMPHLNKKVAIKDIEDFMARMKEENIYLIARIVTFKSAQYAKTFPERSLHYASSGVVYTDRDKIPWASAYDRQLWDYNLGICEEAAALGFNEIQFDYVRFPATTKSMDQALDFNNDLDESKAEAIHKFLVYAYDRLKDDNVYITADVFGWAGTAINDVGIGQHWESVTNVVDYIAPMMYPSHYGPNNYGLPVPDAAPYKTIDASIKDCINRNANVYTPAKLRPWIQDFTATWVKGYIPYGTAEVKAQIQALEDNGVHEFMLWSPSNRYTESALRAKQED